AAPAPETPGPLIGRGRELDRLLAAWRRAAAGRGGALLIEGEAGIGKTALVDAFRRRLGTAARWLAFDAGRGRLTRDPQPEPEGLIVLAENVDRADAPTRAALLRLAHLAPDAPLLVIMTARSGESGALRKVAERLAVPRLDKAARTSLVAALDRRGRLSARARQRIADLSGGLPSLARDLIDCGGALDSPALDPANLFERPSRLAAWLAARLDDFGPLRRVACIAATLGPSADVGTTARLAGMEARVLEARLRAVARCGAPLRLSPGGRVVFEDRLLAAAAAATTLRAQRRLWLAQARATQPIDRDFAVAG
ncbi:MAG: AAA family ATPase, partial [Methylobacteriaceae bacterium]|nr:AAA family ATPase [Methylobacteriaceae bacterium]